jgi:hypothetical protein
MLVFVRGRPEKQPAYGTLIWTIKARFTASNFRAPGDF